MIPRGRVRAEIIGAVLAVSAVGAGAIYFAGSEHGEGAKQTPGLSVSTPESPCRGIDVSHQNGQPEITEHFRPNDAAVLVKIKSGEQDLADYTLNPGEYQIKFKLTSNVLGSIAGRGLYVDNSYNTPTGNTVVIPSEGCPVDLSSSS